MTMTDSKVSPYDELVQSVTLYTQRPLVFHGYLFPFVFLYAGE